MIKSLVMLFVFVASTVLIISPPINPIGHASQQQYVFAQENTIESSYDKTITNTTFFPQIHNYTSPPPGLVNSWIIESKNGAVVTTESTFGIMKNDTGGYIALSKQLLPRNDYSDQVVLPSRIVNSGENITIDGITYHFEDLGLGEAGDMTLIYLPSQKVLFTGDVVNKNNK